MEKNGQFAVIVLQMEIFQEATARHLRMDNLLHDTIMDINTWSKSHTLTLSCLIYYANAKRLHTLSDTVNSVDSPQIIPFQIQVFIVRFLEYLLFI